MNWLYGKEQCDFFPEMYPFKFHKNKKRQHKGLSKSQFSFFGGLNYFSNVHFTFGFLAFQINAKVLEIKIHCISNEPAVSLDIVSYEYMLFLCGLVLSQP